MLKKPAKVRKSKIIQSLIEEHVYITEMIKKNFDPSFTYIPISSSLMKIILNLHSVIYKEHFALLQLIINSQSRLSIKYPNKEYMSLFVYVLLFLIENEDFSKGDPIELKQMNIIQIILNLIAKLYNSGSLSNVEVSSIIVFIIAMSIEPRKEMNIKMNPVDYYEIANRKIKYISIFNLSINLLVMAQSKEVTEIFSTYCETKLFLNKANLFMLTREMKLLHLLEIDQSDRQIELLSKIYSKKYSKMFIDYFMINMTKALQSNKDNVRLYYPVLKKQTDLLFQISKEESDEINLDTLQLKRGFVSNNTPSNGLSVSNIIVKDTFSVLFSFNYSPTSSNKDDQTFIIVFKSGQVIDDKNRLILKDIISFSIVKRKFCLQVLDAKDVDILDVQPNITYLVYFSMKERQEYLLSIKSQDNHWMHKKPCKKMLLKKNFTLYVGKYFKSNFEGYIGPILVFKSLFEESFLFFCFSLRGNYEKLLFIPDYDMNQIDKYDREMNNINEENINYFKSINFFKYYKEATKQLICYIAPLSSIERLHKKIYRNFFVKDCKVIYNKEPNIENEGMFFFENKSLIFEFLKYEGINFLILNYELYGKIMTQSKLTNNQYTQLEQNLCSLFEMSIELFNGIHIELFLKEIKRLVFAISKFLRTVRLINVI